MKCQQKLYTLFPYLEKRLPLVHTPSATITPLPNDEPQGLDIDFTSQLIFFLEDSGLFSLVILAETKAEEWTCRTTDTVDDIYRFYQKTRVLTFIELVVILTHGDSLAFYHTVDQILESKTPEKSLFDTLSPSFDSYTKKDILSLSLYLGFDPPDDIRQERKICQILWDSLASRCDVDKLIESEHKEHPDSQIIRKGIITLKEWFAKTTLIYSEDPYKTDEEDEYFFCDSDDDEDDDVAVSAGTDVSASASSVASASASAVASPGTSASASAGASASASACASASASAGVDASCCDSDGDSVMST